MPLVLRSVKGSKLSILEMDGNFLYLESLILSGGTSGSTLPGGSNTEVQFNDNGQFGGSADFTFDKNSGILDVTQITSQNISATNVVSSEGVTAAYFSNPQIVTSNQEIPDNQNAMMFGPTITILDGVDITVGNESFLTISNGSE